MFEPFIMLRIITTSFIHLIIYIAPFKISTKSHWVDITYLYLILFLLKVKLIWSSNLFIGMLLTDA